MINFLPRYFLASRTNFEPILRTSFSSYLEIIYDDWLCFRIPLLLGAIAFFKRKPILETSSMKNSIQDDIKFSQSACCLFNYLQDDQNEHKFSSSRVYIETLSTLSTIFFSLFSFVLFFSETKALGLAFFRILPT